MELQEQLTEAQIIANYPLLQQLYPEVLREEYIERVQQLICQGYHQTGLFDGKRCIGFMGYHIGIHITCGRFLYIDDLVIDNDYRGRALAKKLLKWAEKVANNLEVRTILLDSLIERNVPYELYVREGYDVIAHHFCKKLA